MFRCARNLLSTYQEVDVRRLTKRYISVQKLSQNSALEGDGIHLLRLEGRGDPGEVPHESKASDIIESELRGDLGSNGSRKAFESRGMQSYEREYAMGPSAIDEG